LGRAKKFYVGLPGQTRSLPSPKIEKNVWANGGYLIFFGGQMAGK